MVQKPWGFYEVLSTETECQVKRIVVFPGHRLSLQSHFYRHEHWYIVRGEAKVTRDNETFNLLSGDAVDIAAKSWHRVENESDYNLIFIEIQTGTYFGEDDIERIEDDYNRI